MTNFFILLASLFLLYVVINLLSSKRYVDVVEMGLSPNNSGKQNLAILQHALDCTGTVLIGRAGEYPIGGPLRIGSNTSLVFGTNVHLVKVNEGEDFQHVLINKNAYSKYWDYNIKIEGLSIKVNGMDLLSNSSEILNGHISLQNVRSVKIERFRCVDLGIHQCGIFVNSFEDIAINDIIIYGETEGICLMQGLRYKITNANYKTGTNPVALVVCERGEDC